MLSALCRTAVSLCLASAILAGCTSADPPRYNVLLLVLDTVRADHVSANGYGRQTTPAIDQLAAEGTNFRLASTVAPRTWQSFASILTGLYPPHHGVRFIFDEPLDPAIPQLASLLGARGYDTAAFDFMPFLRDLMGDRGFDEFVDIRAPALERATEIIPASVLREERTMSDNIVLGAVWDWIAARRTQPFFAYVRLMAAHWPYMASPANLADFDPCDDHEHEFNDGLPLPGMVQRTGGFRLTDEESYRKRFYEPGYDTKTRRHLIAHYDAALRTTDAMVGALLERLRDAGLLRTTAVVVTSDHGEAFGEHGYFTHGARVHNAAMHVPLVIRLPDDFPRAVRGRVVDDLVRVVDIMPTMLDVASAPAPQGLDGISLLPALTGGEVPALWAYGESGATFVGVDPDTYVSGVRGKVRMVRDRDSKLVVVTKPYQFEEVRLFDLRRDPAELIDVAMHHPERVAELRQLLQPFIDRDRGDTQVPRLTDNQVDQLRQLGYH